MRSQMTKNQTVRKLNKKKVFVLVCIIISVICLFMSLRKTFSRYQSQATTETKVDVAFWLVSDTVQAQNVVLQDLEPGETKDCTFSVSNYNGTIRTKTSIDYKIVVKTTTNLPLTYEVYKQTDLGEEKCTPENERLIQDDDGTYYKELTFSGFNLGYQSDETTTYKLKATFPAANNNAALADLVECVNLQINAEQKISE